jgi:hypothetical protein
VLNTDALGSVTTNFNLGVSGAPFHKRDTVMCFEVGLEILGVRAINPKAISDGDFESLISIAILRQRRMCLDRRRALFKS